MGRKTEIWDGVGWAVRWARAAGGYGTEMVGGVGGGRGRCKHSDDFPWVSFIQTNEEGEREREQLLSCHHWQVQLWWHLLHLLLLLFILKTTKKREGWCKKIEMLTRTHTHERQTTSAGSSHRPIRVLTERREEESFLCQTLFYLKCSCFSRFFPLVVLSEKLLVVRTIL